jgi:hypothetical protein
MKNLGKIHLRTIKNKLPESELKFVVGGYDGSAYDSSGSRPCDGKREYECCTVNGKTGACRYVPFGYGLVCDLNQPNCQ